MANSRLGRQGFTVQESVNMEAYDHWYFESKAMGDTNYKDYTYVTSANPAKKIVLYQSAADAAFDSGETLTVKLNGETAAGKEIVIDGGDLPFTITGLVFTSVSIKTSDATATNDVSLLSFH